MDVEGRCRVQRVGANKILSTGTWSALDHWIHSRKHSTRMSFCCSALAKRHSDWRRTMSVTDMHHRRKSFYRIVAGPFPQTTQFVRGSADSCIACIHALSRRPHLTSVWYQSGSDAMGDVRREACTCSTAIQKALSSQ